MAFAKDRAASAKYQTREHRQARAALIAAYQPGDPCCLCGEPMWPPTSGLHAEHTPDGTAYRGLSHARCGVKDGAVRGRQRQLSTRLTW